VVGGRYSSASFLAFGGGRQLVGDDGDDGGGGGGGGVVLCRVLGGGDGSCDRTATTRFEVTRSDAAEGPPTEKLADLPDFRVWGSGFRVLGFRV
jgi:hypothetical protein